MSRPGPVQPVLDAIARTAARLCEAPDALIYTVEGDALRLMAKFGDRASLVTVGAAVPLDRSWVAGRAVIDGKTVHVRDLTARTDYPGSSAVALTTKSRTLLATPLMLSGVAVGVIVIRRVRVRPFTAKQVALLRTFADQAAIAMENARLSAELAERNRDLTETLDRQTATAEILRVISSSPTDVQPVLDTIAASSARLCGALFSSVYRFDGTLIHMEAHYNYSPAALDESHRLFPTPPTRNVFSGRAILERAVVHVPDAEQDPEHGAPDFLHAVGFRSVLSVPMLRDGQPIGAITVWRATPGPFSGTQVALLRTFADQAVIAVENARLFTELESRHRALRVALEQQTATSELLKVIGRSTFDLQPVFETLAENAVRLCGAQRALIYRFDGRILRAVAAHNVAGALKAFVEQNPIAPGRESASGRACLERRTVHIHDVLADPEYRYGAARVTDFRTILAVPILRTGDLLGVILIYKPEVSPFSDGQIALMETFADQAAIAIDNARLLDELRGRTAQLTRSVDELTALGEVSRALSSTLDLETVLNTIVARANQLAGTDSCSVWEYDDVTGAFSLLATENRDEEVVAVARRAPIRKGEGVQGRMAETRAPVQVADIATEGAYRGPLRDVLLRTGTRAVLAVPLLRDDRLVGGLTVNRKTPGEFPPEIVDLLQTFATQSALAINNARLFREIEDKGRQLEIASRHKSQFLANMSHELRTPLNAILGYTELIADGIYGEVPERMREVLERVDKSGHHLLGLINDILDLSKIEAGQLTLALGPYAMDGVAQTVAAQVAALAADKQLAFELAVADDLPIGQGDERRLTQVLLNLVGNAIKFTDAGTVTVRVVSAGDAYRVSVTDTGPGIAEGDLEKIFEEFQQADTTRAKAKGGTGLGLAISRRIVAMHGGRLWVESTLGQGSTFSFTVPVHVERQVAVTRA